MENTSTNGFDLMGIIALLVILGIFSNGLFGFGGNAGTYAAVAGATTADLDSRFNARDIFSTNTNVLENRYANATAEAQTQKDILDSKYATQLGVQSILSNQSECCCNNRIATMQSQYELSQLADRNNFNTLLGNKDLTAAIAADGDKTRALITSQYEATLLEKINDLKAQVSNQEQTAAILNSLGRYHTYPSCSCGYGTCSSSNLI